jgi:predicted amidophosphoribosyltransferase
MVALSNPSISLRENNPISEVTSANSYRVCNKCGAEIKIKTYHCRYCDVCINGYDHHCQWVAQCIGKGNLYRFYFFVAYTPIYILIFIGLMMSCLVISA